jgi:hypothetical protein
VPEEFEALNETVIDYCTYKDTNDLVLILLLINFSLFTRSKMEILSEIHGDGKILGCWMCKLKRTLYSLHPVCSASITSWDQSDYLL